MPPKKKLRGPKLLREEEELTLDTDSFNNSQDKRDEALDDTDVTMREVPADPILNHNAALTAKRMRKLVVEAFRLSFQSRGNINQDISFATQKVLRAFTRPLGTNETIASHFKDFFGEVDIRLAMMVEDTTVVEHRARVFKMIALTTVEMMLKENNCALLDFLMDFFDHWTKCQNVAPRINTTSFISYLLETGIAKLPPGSDKFCGFPLKISETLFCYLKKSLLDKEYQARVPAIRGMACLQSQPVPSNWSEEAKSYSARELLMRSFRDNSWECRLTAMQSFAPKENDVNVLADVIFYDKCLKVRLAALDKFGEIKPNRYVRSKIGVLDTSLKDHEVLVRDRAKQVLKNWITKLSERWAERQKPVVSEDVIEVDVNEDSENTVQDKKAKGFILAGQALVLLWLSESTETEDSHAALKRITMHLLDVIRRMYMCHLEPINTFAETVMNDLREKMVRNCVPIITKGTISSILDSGELVATQDARSNRALVFFWRCLIEYIADRRRHEGDRTAALSRFLCPLKTMVEHTVRIMHRVKDLETDHEFAAPEVSESLYCIQMSFIENFLLVLRYPERDQAGLDAYQSLLITLLMNMCNQKKIVDLIICELSQFYADCPDDMFSLIHAKIGEMRRSFKNNKLPELEETVLVGERRLRERFGDGPNPGKNNTISAKAATEIIDAYELMMVNSALKVGLLKEWGEEYHDRYAKVFKQGSISEKVDSRIVAIECIGITAIYDLEKNKEALGELAASFDEQEDLVKATLLVVFTDLYIEHGMFVIDAIIASNYRSKPSIVHILTDLVMRADRDAKSNPVLLLKAVENLAKILLQAKIELVSTTWQRAIVALMFRVSYAITDHFSAKIRSMIIIMLKFFCSLSKNNQMLVVKAFPRFFEMWSSVQHIHLLAPDKKEAISKLKRCAAAFVALTRHGALNNDKKGTPAHVELFNNCLTTVTGSTNDAASPYYLYALNYIDYESFPYGELRRAHMDLEEHIDVHKEDEEKGLCAELKRVFKKISRILGVSTNEEETDEPASKSESKHANKFESTHASKSESNHRRKPVFMEHEEMDEGPSTSQQPARKVRAAKPVHIPDPLDLIQSPPRIPRKPPSRPNTTSRPATASTSGTSQPRSSARKLRSEK